jgi:hypothetical protein
MQTSAVSSIMSHGPKKEPEVQQRPQCQPHRNFFCTPITSIGWQTPWARLAFFATFCRDDKK